MSGHVVKVTVAIPEAIMAKAAGALHDEVRRLDGLLTANPDIAGRLGASNITTEQVALGIWLADHIELSILPD